MNLQMVKRIGVQSLISILLGYSPVSMSKHVGVGVSGEILYDEDKNLIIKNEVAFDKNNFSFLIKDYYITDENYIFPGLGYKTPNTSFKVFSNGEYFANWINSKFEISLKKEMIDSEKGMKKEIMDNSLSISYNYIFNSYELGLFQSYSFISDENERSITKLNIMKNWKGEYFSSIGVSRLSYDTNSEYYYSPDEQNKIYNVNYKSTSWGKIGLGPTYNFSDDKFGVKVDTKILNDNFDVGIIYEGSDYKFLYLNYNF